MTYRPTFYVAEPEVPVEKSLGGEFKSVGRTRWYSSTSCRFEWQMVHLESLIYQIILFSYNCSLISVKIITMNMFKQKFRTELKEKIEKFLHIWFTRMYAPI